MNLRFPDISSNIIPNDASLTYTNINRILQNFVCNDVQLANPDGYAPKIWECKWYNDDTIPGYPTGYAVWYNTQDPQQFISFYASRIYEYAKNNTYLKNKIEPYSLDQYQLYYNILTGYHAENTTLTLQPLFDIGKIEDAAQIRISLCDNNKAPPSDNKYWKDFIMRDNYAGVSAIVSSMLSTLMASHMSQYHLNSNRFEGDFANYLRSDMSNIENTQKYSSHTSNISSFGFDYVKKFVKVPIEEKYIYSVVESEYVLTCWKLKEYDQITNNGKITSSAKQTYISKMNSCANYVSATIESIIDTLETDALVNIKYTGINSNIIPYTTTDYSLISARLNQYNCEFSIVPLSSSTSVDIATNINNYVEVKENGVQYYPIVSYKYNKWFRLWNSGKLEYGGIVPVSDAGQINVEFGWKYTENGENKTAPIYDYPTTSRSFYSVYTKFSEDKSAQYDDELNLKRDNRYIVQLSPVQCALNSHLSGDQYGYTLNEQFGDYAVNEVNSFKNNGFSIYVDNQNIAKYYQYYVTGFKTDN